MRCCTQATDPSSAVAVISTDAMMVSKIGHAIGDRRGVASTETFPPASGLIKAALVASRVELGILQFVED